MLPRERSSYPAQQASVSYSNVLKRYGAESGMLRDKKLSTSYSVVFALPGIDRIFLLCRIFFQSARPASESASTAAISSEVAIPASFMRFISLHNSSPSASYMERINVGYPK